jgi:hypothetical protein
VTNSEKPDMQLHAGLFAILLIFEINPKRSFETLPTTWFSKRGGFCAKPSYFFSKPSYFFSKVATPDF